MSSGGRESIKPNNLGFRVLMRYIGNGPALQSCSTSVELDEVQSESPFIQDRFGQKVHLALLGDSGFLDDTKFH